MNGKVLTPLEMVSRDLYFKAREQVGLKWHYAYLLLLVAVLGTLIFVSHFTQFRTHVMRAMIYQEWPSNWWDVAIYVVAFTTIITIFFRLMNKIDEVVSVRTNLRHQELCQEYIDQLAEQESYRD